MDFDSSNILSEAEVADLFSDDPIEGVQEPTKEPEKQEETKTTEETQTVDFSNPFEDPESVGSEDNKTNQGKEGTSSEESGSSPIYSSLAKALKEEGIFDLDDSDLSKITNSGDFADMVEKQVQARLDEKQKRIDEALGNGVEPNLIRSYENTLKQLDSIDDDTISAENEQGENLRKNIIYRDFINKGFSQERAAKETNKSIQGGTDIEDAKEALESIKQTVKDNYDKALNDAKEKETAYQEDMKKQAASLRKSVLEDKELFGEMELDKKTRQKVLDNIIKPIYKDPETGDTYTAIQKYEKENRADFLKKVGIIYTLTDGFKNLDGLIKNKVKKEVSKGFKELESTINNTQRNTDGSLNFMSGTTGTDSDSFFSGMTLDV